MAINPKGRKAEKMIEWYRPSASADPVLLLDTKPADPDPIELLTVSEVAALLKISLVGVRRLQQQRLLPFFKVGGSVRFTKSDLLSYLEKHRIEAVGDK